MRAPSDGQRRWYCCIRWSAFWRTMRIDAFSTKRNSTAGSAMDLGKQIGMDICQRVLARSTVSGSSMPYNCDKECRSTGLNSASPAVHWITYWITHALALDQFYRQPEQGAGDAFVRIFLEVVPAQESHHKRRLLKPNSARSRRVSEISLSSVAGR
jgi:hypothetical protein